MTTPTESVAAVASARTLMGKNEPLAETKSPASPLTVVASLTPSIATAHPFVPKSFDIRDTGTPNEEEFVDPYYPALTWSLSAYPFGGPNPDIEVSVSPTCGWSVEGLIQVEMLDINGDTTRGGMIRVGPKRASTNDNGSRVYCAGPVGPTKLQILMTDNLCQSWMCETAPARLGRDDTFLIRITHLRAPSFLHDRTSFSVCISGSKSDDDA